MTPISRIDIAALVSERKYSESQWDPDEFDSENTLNDWVTYICMYATESAKMDIRERPWLKYSKLISAANLALLAAERVRLGTLAPRHYDKSLRPIPADAMTYMLAADPASADRAPDQRRGGDGIVP